MVYLTRTSGPLRDPFSALLISVEESVVSSPMPRMAEMSGVMRISETTRMSLEVPEDDEDEVEDAAAAAETEVREDRRRWKKVSMSPVKWGGRGYSESRLSGQKVHKMMLSITN